MSGYTDKIYLQVSQAKIDWFETYLDNRDPDSGVFVQTGPAGDDQYFCTVDTTPSPDFKKFRRTFRDNFAPFADAPEYTQDPKNADIVNLYNLLDRPNKFTLTVSADSHMTAFLEKTFKRDETIFFDGSYQTEPNKSLNRERIEFGRRLTEDQDQIKLKKFYQGLKYFTIKKGGNKVPRDTPLTDDEILQEYGPDLMTLFVFARESIGEEAANEVPPSPRGTSPSRPVTVKTELVNPDGTPAGGLFVNDSLGIKVELENAPAGKEIYAQFTFDGEDIGYPVLLTPGANVVLLFDKNLARPPYTKPGEWAKEVGLKDATGPVTVTLMTQGNDRNYTQLAGTSAVNSINEVRIQASATATSAKKPARSVDKGTQQKNSGKAE